MAIDVLVNPGDETAVKSRPKAGPEANVPRLRSAEPEECECAVVPRTRKVELVKHRASSLRMRVARAGDFNARVAVAAALRPLGPTPCAPPVALVPPTPEPGRHSSPAESPAPFFSFATLFSSPLVARARRRVFAASESLGRSGGRGGGNLERPIVGDEPLLGRCCAVASASLALRLPVDLLNPLSWPSRGSTFVTGPTFVPRGLRIR
jgi:hypothetical protein